MGGNELAKVSVAIVEGAASTSFFVSYYSEKFVFYGHRWLYFCQCIQYLNYTFFSIIFAPKSIIL